MGHPECRVGEDTHDMPIGTSALKGVSLVLLILVVLGLCLLALRLGLAALHLGDSAEEWMRRGWGLVSRRLRDACRTAPTPGERKLEEVAKQRFICFWKNSFPWITGLCWGFLLMRVLSLDRGFANKALRLELTELEAIHTIDQIGYLGWYAVSSLLFVRFPRILDVRNLNIWIVLSYVHNMLFMFTPVLGESLLNRLTTLNLVHAVIASHSWKASLVFSLNLVWAGVSTYALATSHGITFKSCSLPVESLWSHRVEVLAAGATSDLAIKMVFYLVCKHNLQHEIRSASFLENAFEKLLHGTCDAVVHLDKDMNLRRSCWHLDSLLQTVESAPSLEVGRQNFLDYICREDRTRFLASIQRPGVKDVASCTLDEGHVPDMMQVNMLRDDETAVHVQLYPTSYRDAMAELCYVVGVREWSDDQGLGQQQTSERTAEALERRRPLSQAPGWLRQRDGRDLSHGHDGLHFSGSTELSFSDVIPLEVPTAKTENEACP